jgi:putative tributyrin esterase
VEKFRDGTCPMPRLFLACGQQDSLYPANLRLRDTLQAMNWPLTWYEAPGDHNWFFWNDALGRAMKELLEN